MENQPLPLQKNKHNMFITCHKGLKCENYDEEGPNDTKNMLLPKWGESFDFKKVKCFYKYVSC